MDNYKMGEENRSYYDIDRTFYVTDNNGKLINIGEVTSPEYINHVEIEDSAYLSISDSGGNTRRYPLGDIVDRRLSDLLGINFNSNSGEESWAAKIISKVLIRFLQSPEGIKIIEEELNNYFKKDGFT